MCVCVCLFVCEPIINIENILSFIVGEKEQSD